MEQSHRLLLIDDDPVRCRVLGDYLRSQGFGVVVAGDGEAGLSLVAQEVCDLVLLDDMLPGLGGIEVLRRIRHEGELPVVMLSETNDDIDRIVAFELGADDYLSKSCNLRELHLRLRAILRRARHTLAANRLRKTGLGRLEFAPTARKAVWRGKPLQLTGTEYDLLALLFAGAGRPVAKSDLAKRVLGRELQSHERSVDMHISNLRKKLGTLADGRSAIQTVRGAGYQLLAE